MAGRGHLSSFDLLPDSAEDDVVWACQQLYARKRSLEDIRFELNDRLEAKGIDGIKKSAFQRKAARLAAAQKRMRVGREMFEGLATEFEAKDVDDNTVILGEFIKVLIQELVDDQAGEKTPKQAMELARAYHATVAAQKISTDRRQKIEAEVKAKLVQAAEQAVGAVERSGGNVDAAEVLRLIRKAYGVDEE